MKNRLRRSSFILEEIPPEERPTGNVTKEMTEDDDFQDNIPFTKLMRKETRKIHNISDALVNAKLGLAMADDSVWAEGILIFYEVFRFLEESILRLGRHHEPFRKMKRIIDGMERTKGFESDISFYFGKEFLANDYQIRPSVANYLRHLQLLEEREPLRLLAYVYHLYMGLLSGGQILKRKKEFKRKFSGKATAVLRWFGLVSNTQSADLPHGMEVTSFNDGRSISDIKKEITFTMNDIAADLSGDEKRSLLEESQEVFRRNNEIVNSIKGTGYKAFKNYSMMLLWGLLLSAGLYVIISYVGKSA